MPCCLEAPAPALPRLRYAAEELLAGLGLRPAWTSPGEVGEGIYAGPDPEGRLASGALAPAALRLRLSEAGLAAVRAPGPVAPHNTAWLAHEGACAPLPFASGTAAADPARTVEADVLASAFWWLARAQETAGPRDRHGRFPFAASLQAALGTALVPSVDVMRAWLGAALRARGAPVRPRTWAGAPWMVALTHDVDFVRSCRLRAALGALRREGPRAGAARLLRPGDPRAESLAALERLARRLGTQATFFVKAGASAPEDVPYRLRPLRPWLQRLAAEGFGIGLHPSYRAPLEPARLAAERDRLARALGRAPALARAHFLRWQDPVTPEALVAAGFAADATLGFAEHEGFRCGTAHPFRAYDFAADAPRALTAWPLAVMDTTLFGYRALGDAAAARALGAVLDAARRAGGCAVVLWHNDAGDAPPARWARRLALLEAALGEARATGAHLGPLPEVRWPALS
ncbi:MAG: DUF7033 domain-containing protein [Rubricoccaceae bacterium]